MSCHLLSLPGLLMALQTMEALFTHVFRHYRVPEVSVSLTSGFHLESNGQVERVNQDVGRFLWSYCQDRPGEWAEFIPWAEMAKNSLRHSSTNLSPFQYVLGYQPVLAPWHQSKIEAPAVDEWFKRRDLGRRSCAPTTGREAAKRERRPSPQRCPGVSTRGPGLALDPKLAPPPVLTEAGSTVCGAIQSPEETEQGLLQVTASQQIIVLTPRSMCLSSGWWWLVHSRNLRCGRFLRGVRRLMSLVF